MLPKHVTKRVDKRANKRVTEPVISCPIERSAGRQLDRTTFRLGLIGLSSGSQASKIGSPSDFF